VNRTSTRFVLALAFALVFVPAAFAADDDDAALKLAEPDYTVINLPTSLRIPPLKAGIRITHRFVRPLHCDEPCAFGDTFLGSAFTIDDGAFIGLELRVGIVKNGQVIIQRARANKTINFTADYGLTRQSDTMPLEIAALVGIEGTKNFTDVYSPSVGLAITRLIRDVAAVHVDPIWVNKTNLLTQSGNTFMIGVGARVRVTSTVYLTGEITPRLSGEKPGTSLAAGAIEKRIGGHMFQLNFSNFGAPMTPRQIAQGAPNNNDWYLGFNITRKMF
jgi:hypothetical protein